jgi:hypothetical protein
LSANDWDWKHAREYEYLMLTSYDTNTRKSYAAKLFRSLGQIMHLLQDAAQPQHTRNDAHIPSWIPGGRGAPYETYCQDNYYTEAQLCQLATQPVPYSADGSTLFTAWNPSLLNDYNSDNIPIDFRVFWNTKQYADKGRVNIAPNKITSPLGLAEFSNAFFVTNMHDVYWGATYAVDA